MEKQKEDTRTLDLLCSKGAQAQARYAARLRARGLKQVNFWLTSDEKVSIKNFLQGLRK